MRGTGRLVAGVVLGLAAALPAGAAEGEPAAKPLPVVRSLKVYDVAGTAGVEITADGDLAYTWTTMPQLAKVVVDLPEAATGRADSDFPVASPLITAVKLEQKTLNYRAVARVTINLAAPAAVEVRQDPADRKKVSVTLRRSRP
jgi:hypothetical protein